MSEITPVVTRKRKVTQSSELSTPAVETKRRRGSAVSERTPAIPTGRSVGRKRKINSDNVSVTSDIASVNDSVEGSVTRSLRSGQKRIATESSVSNLVSLNEKNSSSKDHFSVKPPRKSASRRKTSAEVSAAENEEQQRDTIITNDTVGADSSNFSSSTAQVNNNIINDTLIFSPGNFQQTRFSSRQSTSSVTLLPTTSNTPTVAPRSVSKSRKSLTSSDIATLEPATPIAHNIISNLSPHEPVHHTPRIPRTPVVTSAGTSSVQIASVASFPPDTVTSAQREVERRENIFILEDSNNWWSWLSAALLVFVAVGSFYRQLTLPVHEFQPPKLPPAAALITPTTLNATANEAILLDSSINDSFSAPASFDNMLTSVFSQLPNISHIELLLADSLKEKKLTQDLLENLSFLSVNSHYMDMMQQMRGTISSMVDEIDEQLQEMEYSTSVLEQHHELLPFDSLNLDSSVEPEMESLLFTSSYDIRDDPPAIQETVLGKSTREFHHNTEGLSPDTYQAEAERQLLEVKQIIENDLNIHFFPQLQELGTKIQRDETVAREFDQLQVVSGQVEDLFEKVTGESINFHPTPSQDVTGPIAEDVFPLVDEIVAKVSKIIDATNHRIAQHTEIFENRLEEALISTVSAAVTVAINQEKTSILQQVVRDSSLKIEDQINRMPKLPLAPPSIFDEEEEYDKEEYEDDFSLDVETSMMQEELQAMDDIASSAAGARMILLESTNYCVKAKGDPISCARANLRMVNSPMIIQKAGDCYAFEKLEKNDALTVRFFQPATVFGFGLSHFIPNVGASDSDKYNVNCAPKHIYFTFHQASGVMVDHMKRSKLPKMFRSTENFVSFDSSNFTFSPSSLELKHFDKNDQGYSVTQSFPLSVPAEHISKVTLHVRSTEKPNNIACVYRLKVYGRVSR